MKKRAAITLVVDHVLRTSQHLPLDERAALFAAVASIAPSEEVEEQARYLAFALRTVEAAQTKFLELLNSAGGTE